MRGQGSLFQRGKVWWLRFWFRGKPQAISLRTTDAAAARKLQRRHYDARIKGEVLPDAARATVGDLLDLLEMAWIEKDKPAGACKERLKRYPRLARFRSMPVKDFDAVVVTQFKKDCEADGLSPRTVDFYLYALRRAFKLGYEATPQLVARRPTITVYGVDNVRQGFVSPAAFGSVLPTITELDQHMGDFYNWFYWTGMRQGQIAQIEWSMLDTTNVEEWILNMPARIRKQRTPHTIKLRRGRPIRAIIERRMELRRTETPLVFYRLSGVGKVPRIITHDYWLRIWRLALAKHPEMPAGGRPYHLRRSAITNLLDVGVSEIDVMSMTGHETARSFQRYPMRRAARAADGLDRLAEKLQADPGQNNAVDFSKAKARKAAKK